MRDEAAGPDLLRVARDTLIAEVVPGLQGQQRYAALMVANALGMVERELAANGRPAAVDSVVPAFAGPAVTGKEAATALAEAVRAGRLDGDPLLHRALHAQAIQAVRITRPDILTPAERSGGMLNS